LKAILALYKSAKEKPVERWDHSGFMMLYPNGTEAATTSKAQEKKPPIDAPQIPINVDTLEKWDHSGFKRLYSANSTRVKSDADETKKSKKKSSKRERSSSSKRSSSHKKYDTWKFKLNENKINFAIKIDVF
jgi:hypothetical protein